MTGTSPPVSSVPERLLRALVLRRGRAGLYVAPALLAAMAQATAGLQIDLASSSVTASHLAAGPLRFSFTIADDGSGSARLRVEQLHLGDGLDLPAVEVQCPRLRIHPAVVCEQGRFTAQHRTLGRLAGAVEARLASGRVDIHARDITVAGGRVSAEVSVERGRWRVQARAADLDLSAVAFAAASRYRDLSGRLALQITAHGDGAQTVVDDLSLVVTGLSANGPEVAADAGLVVTARGMLQGDAVAAQGRIELRAGAVYFEPGVKVGDVPVGFTLEPAAGPVALEFDLAYARAAQRLHVAHARYVQPGVMSADLSGDLRRAGSGLTPEGVSVHARAEDLGALQAAFLKPLCGSISVLCGIEAQGGLDVTTSWDGAGIADLDARFHEVYVDDRGRRFRVSGLDGSVRATRAVTPQPSALTWRGLGLYRIDFGAGGVELVSASGAIDVRRWADMPVLDGALRIHEFTVAGVGTPAFAVDVRGELTALSMPELCQALGWPIMSGRLSGVFPRASYRAGALTVHGDLVMHMFDGSVIVRGLRIEDLFGRVPVLTTDVDVENIDLEQLTETFSFGRISGRLEGYIDGLRLENWRPTAFDARLMTPPEDDSRHRISQRAVDNLSAIGSGGIGGALQSGFFGMFKEYSYDRLGLGCRLEQGYCTLTGVEDTTAGFYIVTRGGLLPPWIDVMGTGHKVEWNSLLLGIKRMSEGGARME